MEADFLNISRWLPGVFVPLLGAGLLLGCGEPRSDTDATDRITSQVGEDPPGVADPLAPLPDSLRIRWGARPPFECFIYRDWIATEPIAVLASGELSADTLRVVLAGDTLHATTGYLELTGLARVVVMRETQGFLPGDTLLLVEPLGEGFWNVWHDGVVRDPTGFWTDSAWTPASRADGYTIGQYSSDWWIQVTEPNGPTGWVWGETARFTGAGTDCRG